MSRPLIGLVGQKQVGKDTVAAHLCLHYGYTRVALADPLKEMAAAANPLILDHNGMHDRLADYVSRVGWDRAKLAPDVRGFLQRLGTEAVRALEPDFWINRAAEKIDGIDGPVVVTDVRYVNEAYLIREYDGIVIRVTRPGLDNDDPHPSEVEQGTIVPDIVIHNAGTLADLEREIDSYVDLISPEDDWRARWRIS